MLVYYQGGDLDLDGGGEDMDGAVDGGSPGTGGGVCGAARLAAFRRRKGLSRWLQARFWAPQYLRYEYSTSLLLLCKTAQWIGGK